MTQADLINRILRAHELLDEAAREIAQLRNELRDLSTTLENVRSDLATANATLRVLQAEQGRY